MDLRFSDDHLALRDGVRAFLDNECTPEQVRATLEAGGFARERWRGLAEVGVLGLLVGEEHGGLGLDEVPLVLVMEEAGRAALPEPLLETAAVAAPLLAEAGSDELAANWLPRMASGDAVVSVALDGDRAPAAAVADLFLLVRDGELHAVGSGEVERTTPQPTLDPARGLATVVWEPSGRTQVQGDAVREALEAARDRGALAAAAQLVGVADRVIQLAADHAKHREQFGRPIGAFQAVKHLLADALVGVEFARPVVARAALSVAATSTDRNRDVSMAKVLASEAADRACRAALQVHGAIGYTWEHDLHLWLERARSLITAWGALDHHLARVEAAILAR